MSTATVVLAQAVPIVHNLAAQFGVPAPKVSTQKRWRGLRGRYYGCPARIALSVSAFTVDILLHEMAHHLVSQRYAGAFEWDGSYCLSDIPTHGEEFFSELMRVATGYYGDPELYDWRATDGHYPELAERWESALKPPPLYALMAATR